MTIEELKTIITDGFNETSEKEIEPIVKQVSKLIADAFIKGVIHGTKMQVSLHEKLKNEEEQQ